jgi:hypothetical protein
MTTTVKRVTSPGPAGHSPTGQAGRPRDPRYLALRNFAISISVFNIIGYAVLGFEQPWLWPILALATGYITEIGFELLSAWAQQRRPRFLGSGPRGVLEFLLPAHITSLAVNMLLYANGRLWAVLFGVVVAVSQKHVLQAPIAGRMRHFMNPSNLGIVTTLLIFGSWVSIAPPYEFTEWANTYFKLMIPMVILISGTVINAMLTRRTALIVGWMGAFAIQALARHWIWGVQLNTALGVMSGVAFVLFTNYMITDPGTTPTKPRAQFMFGSSVAIVYGALMVFNIVYTLFFATAIICAARGLGWWGTHLYRRRRDGAGAGAVRSAVSAPAGTAAHGDPVQAGQIGQAAPG